MTLPSKTIDIHTRDRRDLARDWGRWETFVSRAGQVPLSYHPAWLGVLERGLRHIPYCLEALEGNEIRGLLPLCYVRSLLFGSFLVSMPYLNYGGATAWDNAVASSLVDRAVKLADDLNVRYLELRQEHAIRHPSLVRREGAKVHMRLSLPSSPEMLWNALSPKVRNQVRKGQKSGLTVSWGGEELLREFYAVFSHNMRDLGTPVFSRKLFRGAIRQFSGRAEFCVVRAGDEPAAAALLLHGWGISEVPSASSLRRYNPSCANMLMYWNLLERSIRRGQSAFDFGRSSPESNTYRFKHQWGATPEPAEWQYYVRVGSVSDMRPDNPRYQQLIRCWQHLPVALTRWIGPQIVRGIP